MRTHVSSAGVCPPPSLAQRSDVQKYQAVRGLMMKKVQRGVGYIPFSIATFPFMHFASGHTYFTQSLQARRCSRLLKIKRRGRFGCRVA